MAGEFSPHVEQLIAQAIAGGLYPSREALLETAAECLLGENVAMVPSEHETAVLKGLESLDAGQGKPWTPADVEEVLRRGREKMGIRE